ncbi:thiamine pyrophosphate-dependent dehydrogenase E1 component subunit alpha [Streptomyces sp. ICBB 8177]|uniref:thiamine pyrophosphate-dependent dehydrogenase E1 component subunit alpha n=1 Tax=Streptomyces sp. ICBB 8177 TaxID=563922 RepID=UPI000D673D7A|nr:thiamine pyrophosphate-dependent dehydrogenase E1 component subunit alpha [Streptomyces sp. ICBB 8177]PWI42519.1 acetoin dehydrogenase [Streptomyces sp. ICBB 8177]
MTPPTLRHRLVRDMVRVRCVEETLADAYRDQRMRTPVHFSIGQEAASVGVCAATRPTDVVYSGHRSHAPYLAKGGDLRAMVAELHGKRTGCAAGRGGSVHLVDHAAGFGGSAAILAEMIPVAVGAAWAFALDGEPRVALTFFGDGASEEGACHEALNFAQVRRLPVVFVCENNGYSIASPLSARQPADSSIRERARSYGMPARLVDGNDVFAVHDAARDAVEWCRTGRGPYFLELATYRWREHVGPGWDHDGEPRGYRPKAEVDGWLERCPVRRAADALRPEDAGIDGRIAAWTERFRDEARQAVAQAEADPFPDVRTLLDGAYAPAASADGPAGGGSCHEPQIAYSGRNQ